MLKISSRSNLLTLAAMAFLILLLVTGCGDNEMSKNITDTVKKTVSSEIDKQATGIKKQVDQVLNPRAEKGKEDTTEGSGTKSEEEKD